MRFRAIVSLRGIWPIRWLCAALQVTCAGFYAWLKRPQSARLQGCDVDGADPTQLQ